MKHSSPNGANVAIIFICRVCDTIVLACGRNATAAIRIYFYIHFQESLREIELVVLSNSGSSCGANELFLHGGEFSLRAASLSLDT
jgi:hypothetical protein